MAHRRKDAANMTTKVIKARIRMPAAFLPPRSAAWNTDRIRAGRARYFRIVTYTLPTNDILWDRSGQRRPAAAPTTKQMSVAHDTIRSLVLMFDPHENDIWVLYSLMRSRSS